MDSEKFLAALDTHELSALAAALPSEFIEHEARRRGLYIGVHAVAAEVMVNLSELDPVPITKETLQQQLPAASEGYLHTVDSLNSMADKTIPIASTETIAEEFDAWFTNEKILAAEALRQYNPAVQFTLVATPNVVANYTQIITAGHECTLRINRHFQTSPRLSSSLLGSDRLSGTNPSNKNQIQFSLIPNTEKAGPEGTVAQQRRALLELQTEHPAIKIPSLLEAVTFWSTLEATGIGYDDSGDQRSYIRHFDLVSRGYAGLNVVPISSFTEERSAVLSDSTARRVQSSRLSVG